MNRSTGASLRFSRSLYTGACMYQSTGASLRISRSFCTGACMYRSTGASLRFYRSLSTGTGRFCNFCQNLHRASGHYGTFRSGTGGLLCSSSKICTEPPAIMVLLGPELGVSVFVQQNLHRASGHNGTCITRTGLPEPLCRPLVLGPAGPR